MITKILPDVEGESNDAPKKFTNIDKEPFEFKWDSKPLGGALGQKTQIESNETVVMPKYLVNYAAMHLARKIAKREAIEAYVPEREDRKHIELANARIQVHNEDREKELQTQIVAANNPVEPKEEEKEGVEEETPVGKGAFKCEVCGFVAKNRIGLIGHMRKHKKK